MDVKRENRGFTLIELIIAIAVLSVISGMFLQLFAVERRFSIRVTRERQVQDAAQRTIEELKGFPFEELEQRLNDETGKDGPEKSLLQIAGIDYQFSLLESGQWELTAFFDSDGNPAQAGQADYFLQALIDREYYSSDETGSVYSVNEVCAPEITNVGSLLNIVLEPDIITTEEELLTSELLLKVNPETDEETETGAEGETITENGEDAEQDTVYDESDIDRYLAVDVSDHTGGEVTVSVKLIYTVDQEQTALRRGIFRPEFPESLSVEKEILNETRRIALSEKTKKPVNRLYLFLPGEPILERIYIAGTIGQERPYSIYLISQQNGLVKNDLIITEEGQRLVQRDENNEWCSLYTNLEQEQPVSYRDSEDRMYRLTVSVYPVLYPQGEVGLEPILGEPLLTLDSVKGK